MASVGCVYVITLGRHSSNHVWEMTGLGWFKDWPHIACKLGTAASISL